MTADWCWYTTRHNSNSTKPDKVIVEWEVRMLDVSIGSQLDCANITKICDAFWADCRFNFMVRHYYWKKGSLGFTYMPKSVHHLEHNTGNKISKSPQFPIRLTHAQTHTRPHTRTPLVWKSPYLWTLKVARYGAEIMTAVVLRRFSAHPSGLHVLDYPSPLWCAHLVITTHPQTDALSDQTDLWAKLAALILQQMRERFCR